MVHMTDRQRDVGPPGAADTAADSRSPASVSAGSLFRRGFGPGLLWAATAIGVSHLVQSTRAGADTGFALAGVILLALVLKYPFFEFGPRYAAATGSSLVEGYRRIGRWALGLYLAITAATAVIVSAAVALFTGFLLLYIFGIDGSVALTGAAVYAGCGLLLFAGRFRLLDRTIKVVMAVLAISTLLAAAIALPGTDISSFTLAPGAWIDATSLAFILALAGWMPSGIDIAVWSSLWTLAKDREAGVRASVRTARYDFLIGYVGTGVLAFAFLTVGVAVMHGTGETFSARGTAFSVQLVDLYAETLGGWARPVVAVAAVTAMFSTALTVVDGFPRAIARSVRALRDPVYSGTAADAAAPGAPGGEQGNSGSFAPGALQEGGPGLARSASPGADQDRDLSYWIALAAIGAASALVLTFLTGSLTGMIDFATIVVFLTGPVLGWLNLRAVTSEDVPPEHRPGRGLVTLSYVGLVLLAGTGVVYLMTLI